MARPSRDVRCVRPANSQGSSSGVINSQSPFWCNQMGSAFLAMNSSTGTPSIDGGRGTHFCLPWMKTILCVFLRSRRARFCAAVRLRFGLARLRFCFELDMVSKICSRYSALSRSEVRHDILPLASLRRSIQIPRRLAIPRRRSMDIAMRPRFTISRFTGTPPLGETRETIETIQVL